MVVGNFAVSYFAFVVGIEAEADILAVVTLWSEVVVMAFAQAMEEGHHIDQVSLPLMELSMVVSIRSCDQLVSAEAVAGLLPSKEV